MTNDSFKKITSLQNSIVKHAVKVNSDRLYREKHGTAVVAGSKMVRELSEVLKLKTLFILDTDENFPQCESTFIVTEEILKKITGLPSPEGMAAEVYVTPPSSLEKMDRILVLDRVSDPGNLGTLIRSAMALGWHGIFLLEGCVDLYNDKTIRASRGASLHFPHNRGGFEELLTLCEKQQFSLFIADGSGEDVRQLQPPKKMVLVLGSEGQGVRDEIKRKGKLISIPISPKMESLNVAIAGSILMFQLGQQ